LGLAAVAKRDHDNAVRRGDTATATAIANLIHTDPAFLAALQSFTYAPSTAGDPALRKRIAAAAGVPGGAKDDVAAVMMGDQLGGNRQVVFAYFLALPPEVKLDLADDPVLLSALCDHLVAASPVGKDFLKDYPATATNRSAMMQSVIDAFARWEAEASTTTIVEDWDAALATWNAYRVAFYAWRVYELVALGTSDEPKDADRNLALLMSLLLGIPDSGWTALASNTLWTAALTKLRNLPNTVEHASVYQVALADGLDGSTVEARLQAAALGLAAADPVLGTPGPLALRKETFATYAKHLVDTGSDRQTMVSGASVTLDYRARMRAGYVFSELRPTDAEYPEGFPEGDISQMVQDYLANAEYIDNTARLGVIDPLEAEQLRDVLFGTCSEVPPNTEPFGSLPPQPPPSVPLWDLEMTYLLLRARRYYELAMDGFGTYFVQMIRNEPANAMEALTRFFVEEQRVRDLGYGGVLYPRATLGKLENLLIDARTSVVQTVDSREAVAAVASGIAGTVAAVSISVFTGGLGSSLGALLLSGAMASAGAASAAVGTRMLVEGPDYLSADELENEAYAASIEGAIDVITGFTFRAVGNFVRMRRVLKEGAADFAAGVGPTAIADAAKRTLASEMAQEFAIGVAEGVLGGSISTMVMTGLDAATWDQAVRYRINTLGQAALQGGMLGAIVGGLVAPGSVLVGRSMGALASRARSVVLPDGVDAVAAAGLVRRRMAKVGILGQVEAYAGAQLYDLLDSFLVGMGMRLRGELTAVQLLNLKQQLTLAQQDLFDTMFVIDTLTAEGGVWRARKRLMMLKERLPDTVVDQIEFQLVDDSAPGWTWPDGIQVDEGPLGTVRATLRITNPDPRSLRATLYVRESASDGVLFEEFAHIVQLYSARRSTRRYLLALSEGQIGGEVLPWADRAQIDQIFAYVALYHMEMEARKRIFDDLSEQQALGIAQDDPTDFAERIYTEWHVYQRLKQLVEQEYDLLLADPQTYQIPDWLARQLLIPARLTGRRLPGDPHEAREVAVQPQLNDLLDRIVALAGNARRPAYIGHRTKSGPISEPGVRESVFYNHGKRDRKYAVPHASYPDGVIIYFQAGVSPEVITRVQRYEIKVVPEREYLRDLLDDYGKVILAQSEMADHNLRGFSNLERILWIDLRFGKMQEAVNPSSDPADANPDLYAMDDLTQWVNDNPRYAGIFDLVIFVEAPLSTVQNPSTPFGEIPADVRRLLLQIEFGVNAVVQQYPLKQAHV